jgi:hypothetical protein
MFLRSRTPRIEIGDSASRRDPYVRYMIDEDVIGRRAEAIQGQLDKCNRRLFAAAATSSIAASP